MTDTSLAWRFARFSWGLPDTPEVLLAFYAGPHYGIRLITDDTVDAEKTIDDLQELGRLALDQVRMERAA